MADPINPFEHHHTHYHDEELVEDLDPAQKSLNDALRVSFGLLKLVMVVVVFFYLFSGIASVKSSEIAVRLRFGKVMRDGGGAQSALLKEGINFTWPFPIEQVVRVPATLEEVDLDGRFWFDDTNMKGTLDEMPAQDSLGPDDGSLLTGDANIVHARWKVTYTLADRADQTRAVDFIENIGDESLAKELVRNAAKQGVVYACALRRADEFILAPDNVGGDAVVRAQKVLDSLKSGINIVSIVAGPSDPTLPLSVRPAYFDVTGATSDSGAAREEAKKERDEILGKTAGEAWKPLWEMVHEYEKARADNDKATADAAEKDIYAAFEKLHTGDGEADRPIGGDASRAVHDARAYRTEVVTKVETAANEFEQLIDKFNRDPRLFVEQSRLELWNKIREGKLVEIFTVREGDQIRQLINRDPRMKRIMEEWMNEQDKKRRRAEKDS